MDKKIDKTIVGLLIVSVLSIALAVLIGSIIVGQNERISQIQADILAQETRRDALNQLNQRFTEIESEGLLQEVDQLLPDAGNFLDVIREIEEIGSLSGNSLIISLGSARLTSEGFELPNELRNKSVHGRTLPENAQYDFLEIELTVRGTYPQLLQFINLFEQSKYYMNITSINVNRISANERVFIDTSFTVEIFVKKVIFK